MYDNMYAEDGELVRKLGNSTGSYIGRSKQLKSQSSKSIKSKSTNKNWKAYYPEPPSSQPNKGRFNEAMDSFYKQKRPLSSN
jgi:hypothetical protein